MTIEPDTKDWTWVLERPCDDCGFDAWSFPREAIPGMLRANVEEWPGALADPDAAVRPLPQIWSPLEYACHVRDVHRLFDERVRLMLEEDGPVFEDWDQDATAVEQAYGDQDPAVVGAELAAAADAVAARYASVVGPQWERPGRRSNGSMFTIETLGRYHLHDVVHHGYDVRS